MTPNLPIDMKRSILPWSPRRTGRALSLIGERIALRLSPPKRYHHFRIVTAVYNAADFIEHHLESIHAQQYDKKRFTHVIIDDASTDATVSLIRRWIQSRRPEHAVELICNDVNVGGCANLTMGFRGAPASHIVLQVDGDDQLPDRHVLAYLNKIYQDPEVWMTYNSWAFPDGRKSLNSQPLPADVIDLNGVRAHAWVSSHLHSFREALFAHVDDHVLIDPTTGAYWRSSVDLAHYLPMLELAGHHAKHVERVTYTYNLHEGSIFHSKREQQIACEKRIRALPALEPLHSLD